MRPYMETAQGNPLRDNSDKEQVFCIDLRVQGGPGQLRDEEDQKNKVHQFNRCQWMFFSPQTKTN